MSYKKLFVDHRSRIYGLALTVVAIASHAQWFNPFSILESGDWQYRFTDQVKQLADGWGTWIKFGDLGVPNIQLSTYPIRGIGWALLTNLGFSYDMAVKITLLIPMALGSFLIPYYVMLKLVKNTEAALAAGVFYGATTYLLIIETRHLFIAMVYILAPLVFLTFKNALEKNTLRLWLYFIFMFCLSLFYELRITYIVTVLLAVYFIYLLVIKKTTIRSYLPILPLLILILIGMNIFWIIPTLTSAGAEIQKTTDRGLFGNNLFSVPQSFTIFRWSWTGTTEDRAFITQPIQWYLWSIPIIVFLGLALKSQLKYKKHILYFLAITLLGLALTKQSSPPWDGMYLWLFNHVPGFSLFREASKFYLITAFGYWGMLGYGLTSLRHASFKYQKHAFGLAAAIVIVVGLVNLKPLVTQEIGALFVSRQVPQDYITLNNFVSSQPDFFRTLWVPFTTSWGVYDRSHPATSAAFLQSLERPYEDQTAYMALASDQQIISSLRSPAGTSLMDNMNVKYVVVPTRETDNYGDVFTAYGGTDDKNIRDYYIAELSSNPNLRRINIGTKDVAIFQNDGYKRYVYASTNYLNSTSEDSSVNGFIESLSPGIDYSTNKSQKNYLGDVEDVLDKLEPSDFKKGEIVVSSSPSMTTLDAGSPKNTYTYNSNDRTLSFTRTSTENYMQSGTTLTIDQQPLQTLITSVNKHPDSDYYISYNDNIEEVDPGERSLGTTSGPITLYETGKRNLSSGDKTTNSADCTNNKPSDWKLSQDSILSLRATATADCISLSQGDLQARKYILSFRYSGEGVNQAGFTISYNDKMKTTVKKKLTIPDKNQRLALYRLDIPTGATKAELRFNTYATTGKDGTNDYTNIQLKQITNTAQITNDEHSTFSPVGNGERISKIQYRSSVIDGKNLIQNPSFEDGPWQKEVGDCNDNGEPADIKQAIVAGGKTGNKALSLSARNHIACTKAAPINVNENSYYFLDFSYRVKKSTVAGYYIGYDDPQHTSYSEKISASDNHWSTFAKSFRTPSGAHHATIIIYAYPDDAKKKDQLVTYDDFFFSALPDAKDRFYATTGINNKLRLPRKVHYDIRDSSHTKINISNATTPFYLTMSESYHANWQLNLDGPSLQGLSSLLPINSGNGVSSMNHFQANEYANGWYIDPAQLCKNMPEGCKKNADGSYDLQLVAEFTPQRWFYVGSAISGVTLVAAVGYLGFSFYRKRRATKPAKADKVAYRAKH